MLMNPKAPLIFGTIVIFGFASYLVVYHPSPGSLSAGHLTIPELSVLSGCSHCHSDEGLASGCLACHVEIAGQLDSGTGFHFHLIASDEISCAGCHPEHKGAGFSLMGPVSWKKEGLLRFRHPHVDFRLVGQHDNLECKKCHDEHLKKPFTLPDYSEIPRKHTYLELTQNCVSCHEDVHAGGLSPECSSCHGQERFRPAENFDHGVFFPLEKGHSNVDCKGCHQFPEENLGPDKKLLPFDKVNGTLCVDCHESPHHISWEDDCVTCHPADASPWQEGARGITPEVHALTGFHLRLPHQDVSCIQCHDPKLPFVRKYHNFESIQQPNDLAMMPVASHPDDKDHTGWARL